MLQNPDAGCKIQGARSKSQDTRYVRNPILNGLQFYGRLYCSSTDTIHNTRKSGSGKKEVEKMKVKEINSFVRILVLLYCNLSFKLTVLR
jgi:hypothetical protein